MKSIGFRSELGVPRAPGKAATLGHNRDNPLADPMPRVISVDMVSWNQARQTALTSVKYKPEASGCC